MSLFKVHVVEADLAVGMRDAVARRDQLGRSIAKLADQVNTPVFFHDYKDPVAGAPKILLECSDTFLELVKKLPGFSKTHELDSSLETERKPSITAHFRSLAAAVKPPVDKAVKPPVDKAVKPPVDKAVKPPVDKAVKPPAKRPPTPKM